MIYTNVVQLYYNIETNEINDVLKYGNNYNSIIAIKENDRWVVKRDYNTLSMINKDGYSITINDKTMNWFRKEQ